MALNIRRRIPLARFAIVLGLAGLGGAWSEAHATTGAPWVVERFIFVAALVLWAGFTLYYIALRLHDRGGLTGDLDHPTTGPFAAYIPAVGILLTAHFQPELGGLTPWVNGVFAAALALVIGQLIARWVFGSYDRDSLHPGYLLPVVSGPSIASFGFATVDEHGAAVAAFGVGLFFWVVFGSLVFGRLLTGGPLSDSLRPSLGILLALPATAGVAWFAAGGGRLDSVTDALGGMIVLMLLVQLILVPRYRAIGFSLDFWAFSFPVASTANYTIRWAVASRFPGWQGVAWTALGLSTAFIGILCLTTIVSLTRQTRDRRARRVSLVPEL